MCKILWVHGHPQNNNKKNKIIVNKRSKNIEHLIVSHGNEVTKANYNWA